MFHLIIPCYLFRNRIIKILNVICLLLVLSPFPIGAEEEFLRVREIINGKSFILESGDKVRLASIQVPNVQEQDTPGHYGRPGEPMGEEAKKALSGMILGKKIRIDYNPGKRDRHNRLLGQVYDEAGKWIQGEMLQKGYAMVYSFNDDSPTLITDMLAREKIAIQQKSGIWANPYYRIITPEETGEFINRFKLVSGEIASVNESHDNIYLNFNKEWRGRFAVFISHKNHQAFDIGWLKSLTGKKLRVRGWINYHNAPMMTIDHPGQLEIE